MNGGAILFCEATAPDDAETAFNDWYDTTFAPGFVHDVPGFLSAQRYRSDAGPHYLAVYEMAGAEALDEPAYSERAAAPEEMLDAASGVTRYVGEERFALARGGDMRAALDAPVILCVFLTVPMERCGAFEDWFDREQAPELAGCGDWLMTRRFEVVEWDPEPYTHMLLHYLGDMRALGSPLLAVDERWSTPHRVAYRRHGARIQETGRPAATRSEGRRA